MTEFQSCKIYRYHQGLPLSVIEERLTEKLVTKEEGIIYRETSIKNIEQYNDSIVFDITVKRTRKGIDGEVVDYKKNEHGVAISTKNEMMTIFRPETTERIPELLSKIIEPDHKQNIFEEGFFEKERVQRFVDGMIRNKKNTVTFPRFNFGVNRFEDELSFLSFSLGIDKCSTLSPKYKQAFNICMKLEPILNIGYIKGLNDNDDVPRALSVREPARFRFMKRVSIECWLVFLYAYCGIFIKHNLDGGAEIGN